MKLKKLKKQEFAYSGILTLMIISSLCIMIFQDLRLTGTTMDDYKNENKSLLSETYLQK
ncbi:MAG: hypothetical protein ACK5K7_01295 [Bacilli bacterium]